jgi:hypothetical protein
VSDEKKIFDEREHFVIQMGVFVPEGVVPDDARRISLRYIVNKDHVVQTNIGREIIAMTIRNRAEDLIQEIYKQMDRQENDRD